MFCHTRLLGCRKNFRELLGNGLIIRGSGVGIPHLHTKPLVYYLHILYKIVVYHKIPCKKLRSQLYLLQ